MLKPCTATLLTAAFFAFATCHAAKAAPRDEAASGAAIAAQSCAACHDIAPYAAPAPPGSGKPPAFAWIAARHPHYLDGVLLRPPHAMWGVVVTPAQAQALRAYFLSLRGALPQS